MTISIWPIQILGKSWQWTGVFGKTTSADEVDAMIWSGINDPQYSLESRDPFYEEQLP